MVYSITVATDQASGVYKLAQGAENFNSSIAIVDSSGNYDTLSVNTGAVLYNGSSYSLELTNGNLTLTVSQTTTPVLNGSKNGVSFTNIPGNNKTIEFSKDNFSTTLELSGENNAVDTYGMPNGTYQWQVCNELGNTFKGENIVSDNPVILQELISDADGILDVFFANTNGKWTSGYAAQHTGILNGWSGTNEQVTLTGKNKLADIFEGSTDANVLLMTDDTNGDALFVDDVFTAFGKDAARIAEIDEIRAGLGDDVVDLTSQKFAYAGDGVKIYGGLGNDTIWANNGKNTLFGDAGNDRLIGGSNNDVIIGGVGNDRMHGGGGSDIFCFGEDWGNDTVEQLSGGSVTLWFEEGSAGNWNAATLTYTDGTNSIKVSGISADNISLKFGDDGSLRYDELASAGCFDDAASEKIFEDKNKGMLA